MQQDIAGLKAKSAGIPFSEADSKDETKPETTEGNEEEGQGIARINRDRLLRNLPPIRRTYRPSRRPSPIPVYEMGPVEHPRNLSALPRPDTPWTII
jgi:hypothetical protein